MQACSCGVPPAAGADGGDESDGGDGAGIGDNDAGTLVDEDAGPAEQDAGIEEQDAGPEEQDAGPPLNQAPSVSIASPSSSSQFARGESISFTCEVSDPEDGSLPASSIQWRSSLGDPIGSGAQVQNALTTMGTHTITCTATDSAGLSASDEVGIEVTANFVPDVTITEPTEGSFHLFSEPISFLGSAVDPEDGLITGTDLRWLDNDGVPFGTGATVSTALPIGEHLITFEAEDSEQAIGSTSVLIHVVDNLPPVCTIEDPGPGAHLVEGVSFDVQASCFDPDNGNAVPAVVTWSSDLEGEVGSGLSGTIALFTPGTHTLTVCAVDTTDEAVQGCRSITVTVDANDPPTVGIESPVGGSYPACAPLSLRCAAADPEGGNVSVAWTSSREGALTQDANDDFTPSVGGSHVLTCTAVDEGGKQTSAQVAITIESPTVRIISPDDGLVIPLGSSVQLSGEACDAESGQLAGTRLVWLSSLESPSQIATGQNAAVTLGAGAHQISLVATDPDGNQGVDSVQVSVNAPPSISISSPSAGAIFDVSAPVVFSAAASDPEDGPLTPTWHDPTLGDFFVGASTSRSDLIPGLHRVTARVSDSVGLEASDGVSFEVRPGGAAGDPLFATRAAGISIREVAADGSGGSWLATDEGLLHLDASGLLIGSFTPDNSDLPSDQVLAVTVLVDGTLAVGTNNGLAWSCSTTTGECEEVYQDGDLALESNRVTSIVELPDGRTVVGTADCLMVSHWPDNSHADYCGGDGGGDGLVDDAIRSLVYDAHTGGVWVATPDGASFMTLAAAPSVAASFTTHLAGNDVQGIAVAPSSDVWFATDDGLTRYSGAVFTSFRTGDGLPSNDIRDVAVDVIPLGAGTREIAWAATSQGLGRVDAQVPSVQAFTVADGLPSNDCRSVHVDPQHVKHVGTAAGVALYRGW